MMLPVMHNLSIRGVHADALFASGLQRCDEPSVGQVRMAVATAIREFGYTGCAARVAQEYGDHPETAVIRMRWARAMSSAAFAEPALQLDPGEAAYGRHPVRPRFPADRVAGSSGTGRRDRAVFLAGPAVS
jgi:hypothetical protein